MLTSTYLAMLIQGSILDPIHDSLPPLVWEDPRADKPTLKPQHAHWITKHIYDVLEAGGYSDPHKWLQLILTGSLTTYQYSDDSDCDVSLFVDSQKFPEWSRSEMIGLMIDKADGVMLAGTPYPMQCFVVSKTLKPHDLYKEGLRSGYDIRTGKWIQPPDHARAHDVQQWENGFYTFALQQADKMESLLRYEPDKAVSFWHQLHRKRMRDQTADKGEYSEANIIYKMLQHRKLMPQISEVSGEYIARAKTESPFAVTVRTMKRDGCSDDEINAWWDYLAAHNEADRDHGELDDVPDEQVERWYENWESEGRPHIGKTADYYHVAPREQGRQRYEDLSNYGGSTEGLDRNWDALKEHAYQEALKPWGGTTINAATGQPLQSNADLYAMTVKEPGMSTISVPENPAREDFHAAMDRARQHFEPVLQRGGHHLGVFHDDDEGRIDIDPTLVVDNLQDVESIGAYTHNIGGAYHFRSGDGYFPPHVRNPTHSWETSPA